jgi:hypothetical protein
MLTDLDFVDSAQLPEIVIPRRGMAHLDNVRGMTLHVVHGSAWITQSDSRVDVSLSVGESFCLTRNGRTLIAACHHAPFTVLTLEPGVAVPLSWVERLHRLLLP